MSRHKSNGKLSKDHSEILPMLDLNKDHLSDDDENVIFESPVR